MDGRDRTWGDPEIAEQDLESEAVEDRTSRLAEAREVLHEIGALLDVQRGLGVEVRERILGSLLLDLGELISSLVAESIVAAHPDDGAADSAAGKCDNLFLPLDDTLDSVDAAPKGAAVVARACLDVAKALAASMDDAQCSLKYDCGSELWMMDGGVINRDRGGILGIDPGLDGAVAAIGPLGVAAAVTPTLATNHGGKRQFDVAGMIALLEAQPVELAVIEAVGSRPGQGVASSFRFGQGYGLWLGLLAALRIPHITVMPPAWKKVVLAGTARDKAAAIAFVGRRFPAVSLLATPRSRVPHDGLADALCFAEYGRRQSRDHGPATHDAEARGFRMDESDTTNPKEIQT